MPETITIRGEGITLELLLHRRYGVRGRELISATLDLNPGVADLGAVLPLGTPITAPDLPPKTAAVKKMKTLFGTR